MAADSRKSARVSLPSFLILLHSLSCLCCFPTLSLASSLHILPQFSLPTYRILESLRRRRSCRIFPRNFLWVFEMGALTAASAAVAVVAAPAVSSTSGSRRSFFQGQRLNGLVCNGVAVQRVARMAIEARLGNASLAQLEGSVKQAIKSLVDPASQSAVLRNATLMAMNALMVLPALAEEVKEAEPKGKIFDFNLTLPIIAVQFLLLMVALDNIWFKPVAKVMDERDSAIRSKLMGVRDNSGEIKKLQEEAEAILKAARIETTMALNKTKKETAAALDEKLQESRSRIEKELAVSLKNLEEQKEETLRSLDKQVQTLSEEILSKVIPFKV